MLPAQPAASVGESASSEAVHPLSTLCRGCSSWTITIQLTADR